MNERMEKMALLVIAGICVVALTLIAVMALRSEKVDANGAALIGVVVTGLIAFGKDIVAAIRGYSMSAQLGKVTDQLAASGPAAASPPLGAGPAGTPDDPVSVTETKT